jgi:hypothetical protein
VAGTLCGTFTSPTPTPTPTSAPPTPTPTPESLQLVYTSTLNGGISPGGFSISVNGVSAVSTNSTDYGYINVPYNSLIDVYIQAPVGDTSGGMTTDYYSQIYAQDQSGIIATTTTANASTSIQFYITSNTDVYGTASVSNDGEPVIQ